MTNLEKAIINLKNQGFSPRQEGDHLYISVSDVKYPCDYVEFQLHEMEIKRQADEI